MVIQQSIEYARSQEKLYTSYPYYYWLTPGRIVGIAIGAAVLILLILSMLTLACRRRRRRRAKVTSQSAASDFSGQPQQYPLWREPQPLGQMPYRPGAPNVGWYYPAPGSVPPYQAKSTFSGQAERAAPLGQVSSTIRSEQAPNVLPLSEAQGSPPSDWARRPAPTSQVVGASTSLQRPPTSQTQITVPSPQVQHAAPLVQAQEQGTSIPPSGRDQSPPPYYPPSPPPPAHTAR
ncbi:hypothetical protein L210DRAFT_931816 [Boletus edulis BED1]|uniref:Uncharacterized protein n=1 Tax=Boletus edulis BED1 TaxID=1328754 RepID=A0AAD4C441_BOLED|nr:hypothetical protein L210DRAFT_931816 [Boletus edulis BED1]